MSGSRHEIDQWSSRVVTFRLEGEPTKSFTGDWEDWPRHYHSAHGDVAWVLFADEERLERWLERFQAVAAAASSTSATISR